MKSSVLLGFSGSNNFRMECRKAPTSNSEIGVLVTGFGSVDPIGPSGTGPLEEQPSRATLAFWVAVGELRAEPIQIALAPATLGSGWRSSAYQPDFPPATIRPSLR